MDSKREILNFVRDKRLNVVEELHEKELQLLDITTTLSVGQDFSLVMDNLLSLTPAQLLCTLCSYSQHVGQLERN